VSASHASARDTEARRKAWRMGGAAERLCAWSLRLRGYRVLARRFRSHAGEIDLIAKRGHVLAFIEVKARPTHAQAAEAVTPRQRQRVERAALAFVQAHPRLATLAMRFDAMLVAPRRPPRHIVDAWRPRG
jgi:putative endonuclease